MAGSEFPFMFIVLAVIFSAMKTVQYLMNRLKQPEVLGEVILGFILGPSVLGIIYISKDNPSSRFGDLLNIEGAEIINAVKAIQFIAEFAALLLLFKVGLEINFSQLKKVGKPSLLAAFGGISVPLLSGVGFLVIAYQLVPELLVPEGVTLIQVALFIGAALTATSIGISTRIFLDLGKLKSIAAQVVVGAAVIDDVVSLTILSLTISYVNNPSGFSLIELLWVFGYILAFFVICVIAYLYILPPMIERVKKSDDRYLPLFSAMVLMLVMSFVAYLLGLATIIGAFAAGVIIENEEKEYLHLVEHDFEILEKLFVPIFFVSIGLGINIGSIISTEVILLGLSLASVAILAKIIGGTLGSRLSGKDGQTSFLVGLSMAAKGEVTLIFAFTAFDLGIFSEAVYAATVFLVVIDSLVIPTLLKYFISKTPLEMEETSSEMNNIPVTT